MIACHRIERRAFQQNCPEYSMREIDFFLALANFTKHVKAGESENDMYSWQKKKEEKLCYYEVRRKWEEAPICILE